MKSYFLSTSKHDVPGLIRWWQGTGAMVNVTNEAAVEWFVHKLERLQSVGVSSFKFDAGEACYMPAGMWSFEQNVRLESVTCIAVLAYM